MWAGRNDQFRSHVLHGFVYAAAVHDAPSQGGYSKLKGESITVAETVEIIFVFINDCAEYDGEILKSSISNIKDW